MILSALLLLQLVTDSESHHMSVADYRKRFPYVVSAEKLNPSRPGWTCTADMFQSLCGKGEAQCSLAWTHGDWDTKGYRCNKTAYDLLKIEPPKKGH